MLTRPHERPHPPPAWLQDAVLGFLTLFFGGLTLLLLFSVRDLAIPLSGRVLISAVACALLAAVLSLWKVTRAYRQAGAPADWRSISRESATGEAFWQAWRVTTALFALALVLFGAFVALALNGTFGGYSPLWRNP